MARSRTSRKAGPGKRVAEILRRTRETQIRLRVDLDGSGQAKVKTPIGFLDHMFEIFARHALVDLELAATGDVQVDQHHTVEDLGIALGQALDQALGAKAGIVRVGSASVPLDETLARATIDLSGRPFLAFSGKRPRGKAGGLEAALILDFLQGLTTHLRATLHVELAVAGGAAGASGGAHHAVEALFKALARALRAAWAYEPRERGVPSTKGRL